MQRVGKERRRPAAFGGGAAQDGTLTWPEARLMELERERAALEMFAGVAAHELMAPLIAAETHARMRVLVETLLNDARSSGRPLERRPVNLQRLVDEGIALLAAEIAAHEARVVATQLPVVEADEVLLAGVVNNLLLNALRYGPRNRGEVRIEARRVRE